MANAMKMPKSTAAKNDHHGTSLCCTAAIGTSEMIGTPTVPSFGVEAGLVGAGLALTIRSLNSLGELAAIAVNCGELTMLGVPRGPGVPSPFGSMLMARA